MFTIIVKLSVLISCVISLPTNSKDLSASDFEFNLNYDQRQIGQENVRIHVKDVVFALPSDILVNSGYDDYLDDSNYGVNSTTTNNENISDKQAEEIVMLALANYLSKSNENTTGINSGSPLNKEVNDLNDKLQNDEKYQQSRFVNLHQIRKFIKRWFRF